MNDLFTSVLSSAMRAWYLWLPFFSFLIFFEAWMAYARNHYKATRQWCLLEVRIPREIIRGPKVMEQLFASVHNFGNVPQGKVENYWDGEYSLPLSFEITSFGGEVHFYVRAQVRHKNIMEANLQAFYPDLEVAIVDDYIDRLPSTLEGLYRAGYKLWGTELMLAKEDAYPVRTYVDFESMDDYSKVDPIAALIEILGKIQPGEEIWIQMLIIPIISEEWKKDGERLVLKLKEEGKERVVTLETGVEIKTVDRSPGKTDILKAIEHNISKPGFRSLIRYLYIAKSELYNFHLPRRGILGAFNQYAIETLNRFLHNVKVRTEVLWYFWPYFFPDRRNEHRKRYMLYRYRNRKVLESTALTHLFGGSTISKRMYAFNTEELATLYHYPTNLVLTAPTIARVESRKMGPPAGLAIYGEEEQLKGFKPQ